MSASISQLWKVVGGAATDGIMVREERSTKSAQKGRLSPGSILEEISQTGDRLNFVKIRGDGPSDGWVSIHNARGDVLLELQKPDADRGETQWVASLAPPDKTVEVSSVNTLEEVDADDPRQDESTSHFEKWANQSIGIDSSSREPPNRESSLILPGPAALEAWFEELARRARAHRPCMPASNLAQNTVPSMFLVFTSMSGLLGLSRQWEYATSNSYLDALLHFRHKQGLSGREMHIGNVNSVGMGAAQGDGSGVSPAQYGQIFTHIISHVEHPGAEIFETPSAFPQMGRFLNIVIPYLRAFDAKHAAMQSQQNIKLEDIVSGSESPTQAIVQMKSELAKDAKDAATRKVMQEANAKLNMSLEDLKTDPEMQDFFEEIKRLGPDGAKKFLNDEKILKKFAMATSAG